MNEQEKCTGCGGDVVLRSGPHGEFKACSNYPECKVRVPQVRKPVIKEAEKVVKSWEGPTGEEPVIVAPKGVYVNLAEKPKKSYELTDGNIRIGALTCAIAIFSGPINSNEVGFWDRVKEFEEYIRNGK